MNIKLKSRRINDNIIQYYKTYVTNNGDEYNSIEEYNKHSMDYKSLKDYNINESYETFALDLSEYLGDYFIVKQFDILNGCITVRYFSTILDYEYKDIFKMESINLIHTLKRKIFDIEVPVIKIHIFKNEYVIFKDIKEQIYKAVEEIENKINT